MEPTVEAIEQAMIARVENASGATLGYEIPTVTSYGGELDDGAALTGIRYPAVWFVYLGTPRPKLQKSRVVVTPRFAAIVAAENSRNEEARRHGDGASPGSYQILRDLRKLLGGQSLALEIQPLVPGLSRSLFNGLTTQKKKRLSVFAQEFETRFYESLAADEASLDDFETFHADWDVAAPDGEIDAQDDVTLEVA